MKTFNIIIVDDSEDYSLLLEHCFLEREDVNVTSFTKPEEALEFISKHIPKSGIKSLLITDVMMPDLSGIELAKNLKTSLPHLKICFLSNSRDEATINDAFNIGACEYIFKNRTKDEIFCKINKVIDNDIHETPNHLEVYEISDVLSDYKLVETRDREVILETSEEVSVHSIIKLREKKKEKLYKVEKCELKDNATLVTCKAI